MVDTNYKTACSSNKSVIMKWIIVSWDCCIRLIFESEFVQIRNGILRGYSKYSIVVANIATELQNGRYLNTEIEFKDTENL